MTKNQYKKLMQNELVWALYEDLMYEGNVQEWNEILKDIAYYTNNSLYKESA